jgi:hypothetical protein
MEDLETHRIDRANGQVAYQYSADKKVKKLTATLANNTQKRHARHFN